jgi:O-antigen/teichoic acid export membrane protein
MSSLAAAVLGFLATVYVARVIGPEPLGIYNVTIGLASWLGIVGELGVGQAVSKRLSEGNDQGSYVVAGLGIILLLFAAAAVGVLLFNETIVDYVGYPIVWYLLVLLLFLLLNGFVNALLVGVQLVHVSGVMSPVRVGVRAFGQIGLVALGASTAGLFIGHIAGYVIGIVGAVYFVLKKVPQFSLPQKHHVTNLTNFAKFAWLGSLQSRMFNYTDILILGAFVSSGLIGVYAVAWNISQFLILFSGTLQSTLFPEMSQISSEQNPQAVSRIVEQSLTFGGLILVPGLFGGALLGERILRLYGPEFPRGATILTILIVANLCMGYQNQLLNTLNAVDRPQLAFRVNAVFVVGNVTLNVVLIYFYGWIGAAVATTVSVGISLLLAYRYVTELIEFETPLGRIGKQWVSALVMAGVVYGGLWLEETYRLLGHNVTVVIILVCVGAAVYFGVLMRLSSKFRDTVDRNIPFELPFV